MVYTLDVWLSGTLEIVAVEAQTGTSTIIVGDGPNGVAYNPSNNNIYVSRKCIHSICKGHVYTHYLYSSNFQLIVYHYHLLMKQISILNIWICWK